MSTPVLHHHPAHKELLPVQGPGRGTDRRAKPVAAESADPTAAGGLAAQTADRRAKRDALAARGINPYPTRFERSATLAELHSAYAELEPDTRTGEVAKVAGRVVSMRGHGKLRFVTIEDTNSFVQLMFQADHLGRGHDGRRGTRRPGRLGGSHR